MHVEFTGSLSSELGLQDFGDERRQRRERDGQSRSEIDRRTNETKRFLHHLIIDVTRPASPPPPRVVFDVISNSGFSINDWLTDGPPSVQLLQLTCNQCGLERVASRRHWSRPIEQELQRAPIKNNPLAKIHYLSYCNRFFHQIYSFHRGGFAPHTHQISSQYLLLFKNYN